MAPPHAVFTNVEVDRIDPTAAADPLKGICWTHADSASVIENYIVGSLRSQRPDTGPYQEQWVDSLYNPLDKRNIGESILRELLSRPPAPLPPDRFSGAGVYALYYAGDHPAYAAIAGKEWPIYVGKAEPPGRRRGGLGLEPQKTDAMWARLREHADTIREVTEEGSLRLSEFSCRYLVVDDVWIPLGETLLIQRFLPLWNRVVDGFGNHDPGGGRRLQKRSPWDELHPGRRWAKIAAEAKEPQHRVVERIERHFKEHRVLTEE